MIFCPCASSKVAIYPGAGLPEITLMFAKISTDSQVTVLIMMGQKSLKTGNKLALEERNIFLSSNASLFPVL